MEGSAVQFELREHDRRISGLHRTVGGLSTDVGQHKTDIAVLKRDLNEVSNDVKAIKEAVEEEGRRNRASNGKVIWALVGLSLSAAGSAITVALTLGGHP
jgi:hypothetical protein